jgi:hypothetical protein
MLVLASALDVAAQQRVGDEFQVNTFTTGGQDYSRVARQPGGRFMVVWGGPDGSSGGAFGRLYDTGGSPATGEFRVNSYTTGLQYAPDVGTLANGEFVVVWTSMGQDGSNRGVFGQRVGPGGLPLGVEFRVNTYTTNEQWWPRVAADAAGNFVVVWDSQDQDGELNGIFAQCFTAAGVRVGAEFQVNTHTTAYQYLPDVAVRPTGEFVVSWTDDPRRRTFARRYFANCTPGSGEFEVLDGVWATLGMDAAGNFAVGGVAFDGSSTGIWAGLFSSDGTPRGAEFQVNTVTSYEQLFPQVAMAVGGDFVVTWESYDVINASFDQPSARAYRADGTPASPEFLVPTYTAGIQQHPDVAMEDDGDFVVVWTSDSDGDASGINAQLFRSADVIFADGFE